MCSTGRVWNKEWGVSSAYFGESAGSRFTARCRHSGTFFFFLITSFF